MSEFAKLLASLYPDAGRARLLLISGTNLNPDQIDLQGDATTVWERILDAAWNRNRLPDVFEAAAKGYPERRSDLDGAMQQYLTARRESDEGELSSSPRPSNKMPREGDAHQEDIVLPPHLVAEIEHGNVVLMLGPLASTQAANEHGQHPPTPRRLAEQLAKRFLPTGHEHLPLSQVAELAANEANLFTVQEYVADLLKQFRTTATHKLLSSFRWRGLCTTNCDVLIEDGYSENPEAPQRIVPIVDNTEKFDELIRDRNDLLLLKLNGCVTRTNNPTCPLILTTDQYVPYSKSRSNLFTKLKEWASERSIVFVGYLLQDGTLRQIIEEIEHESPSRPRYYIVVQGATSAERRLCEARRITVIDATFDTFLAALDRCIPEVFRGLLPTSSPGNDAIREHFQRTDVALSSHAQQFLDNDVEYVKGIRTTANISPELFYKGVDGEWSAIERNLDVRRHLVDELLTDFFLTEPRPSDPRLNMIVIKAHAGAGKSVLLRRLAWDAAKDYGKLCLYLRPEGVVNTAALVELAELTDDTIYLFIDTAIDRRREIEHLFRTGALMDGRITIATAARTNEWNQAPESLKTLAEEEYSLPYLSDREIDQLLALLERHKALGRLGALGPEERKDQLQERAGRQLLVALHEATLGKLFEAIIADEYAGVNPPLAQHMYLTVCLLSQFGINVRPGIISRMHGISFERFEKEFFAPLEQIIVVHRDRKSGDYAYAARHPHIAEIVVKTSLTNKEDLFHEVIKTITYLNKGYKSDYEALRRMLQARELVQHFSDHALISQIYETARKVFGEDPYLYLQQLAIYEMNRADGDLAAAERMLVKALDITHNSRALRHTFAELLVRRAEASSSQLERDKYLNEGADICAELKRRAEDAYPFYTAAKIAVARIRYALEYDHVHDQTLETYIRLAERELAEGQQRFPENSDMRSIEAKLAETLSNSDRVLAALKKSFDLNQRNSYIAIRLANCYSQRGDLAEAIAVLRKALDTKRSDRYLNFAFARLLLENNQGQPTDILYHLERSYTAGDHNYDARFLHARQLFIMGKAHESRDVFTALKHVRLPPSAKNAIRYPLAQRFEGAIVRMEDVHCWIARDGDRENIYLSRDRVNEDLWRTLSYGTRVTFQIGFTMRGTAAFDVMRS